MTISVIIPVYNEEPVIESNLHYLHQQNSLKQVIEIIVVDGGSSDDTMALAAAGGAKVIPSKKGRSCQMNAGAAIAQGTILYFLHADTRPPSNFIDHISQALAYGYTMGCFRLQFDEDHWFLKSNAWFTRFNINAFRFGDQSLFVTKAAFQKAGGFNEQQIILEDQEIISRLQQYGKLKVMPAAVITSSRKYIKNGIYKTQAVYFLIYALYRLGINQQRLLKLYKKMIRQDK